MADRVDGGGADRWLGSELMVGPNVAGQVQGLLRDPVSGRVRRLVTSYAAEARPARQVAVPVEWVVRQQPGRTVLGVGLRELDCLPTYREILPPVRRPQAATGR